MQVHKSMRQGNLACDLAIVFFASNSQVLLQYQLCPWEITIAFQAWCENFATALHKFAVLENWYIFWLEAF